MTAQPGHLRVGDERVEDRLLGGLDDRREVRVQAPQGTKRSVRSPSPASPWSVSGFVGNARGLPVESARKRSPEKCEPAVPVRPTPVVTRRASALHWCASSGASVATIATIEPAPGGAK